MTSGSQGAADSVVVLLRSQSSGLTASRELAIRDAETWRATWATLQAAGPSDGAGGAPAPPAVDFAREMVLLVASGERSSGGWDVTVDAVERGSDGGATVRYTITEPGPGCMTAQVITAPAVAVRAARVAGTVRFAGRTVRRDC
ncbi:MAG TPA: protease complex subunit PrcB family protein [Gemmatirosa sp.]|nr:protease complex subunit PrcB family protein [Gemmatirosa sp.]